MATRVQPQLLPQLKKDSITMNARENQVRRFQKAMEQPIDTELSASLSMTIVFPTATLFPESLATEIGYMNPT